MAREVLRMLEFKKTTPLGSMDLTLKARQLENDLKAAEDDGDPMEVWTKYHEWLEEHKYTTHPSYNEALMESITYFNKLNHYNSDVRLANIYIKLAGVSVDPEAVLKHMLSTGVCTQHAVVYDTYARKLELKGSLQAAVKVVQQGIQNKAQPIVRLHKRLDELKARSMQVFSGEQPHDNKLKNSSQLDAKACDQDSPRTEDFYSTPGIVVHYDKRQVYPPEGGEHQMEEVRAMMKQYRPPLREDEQVEMEMTEVCSGNITLNVPMMAGMFKSHQAPANKENFIQQPSGLNIKGTLKITNSRQPLRLLACPEQEDMDSELDRLCQEKPYQSGQFAPVSTLKEKELSDDSFSEALEKLEIQSTEKSTGPLVQQQYPTCVPLEGSAAWNTRLGDSVSTKLNFSDVESISISRSSLQHTAGDSMLSFEAFHDSAVKDTSRQQIKDLARPPLQLSNVRRPLQALSEKRPLPVVTSSKPLLAAMCNQENQEAEQSRSWQPSHHNSMAADGQESSFAPFHDSWASTCKQEQYAVQGNVAAKPLSCQPVIHLPLEAPIMGHTMNSSCVEASFTQVGICHPKQFDPTSTPMVTLKGTDFTFDMSAIADHHQPMAKGLSPITEEPSSFKSSSSSRSSNSTASSVPSEPPSSSHSHFPTEFNPFLPQYVNTMLNTLSHPAGDKLVVRLNSPLSKIGTTICLDGHSLNLQKVTEGGFATVYLARGENDLSPRTLKVQSPPCEWEIAIMVEVRERLKKTSSRFLNCFMEIEKSFLFTDCSVISFPYFPCGTLLDLSNACRSQTIEECVATYYTLEILHIVHALHSTGIIHADIKPDNFMLRDVQQFPDSHDAMGQGLCLTDFGRAIDTSAFSANTTFTGSCNTEDFQCVQMIENKTWKWQIDWFGIAATVYALIAGNYMKVTKTMVTGLYKPQRNCPRRFASVLWTKFFEKLINTSDTAVLVQLISEFESKMRTFSDIVFSSTMRKTWSAYTQYRNR